jgi:hypothetical protein
LLLSLIAKIGPELETYHFEIHASWPLFSEKRKTLKKRELVAQLINVILSKTNYRIHKVCDGVYCIKSRKTYKLGNIVNG